MTQTRYTVNHRGIFEDRHGNALGRVTGLVIDFDADGLLKLYEAALRAKLSERAKDRCERCGLRSESLEMHHRPHRLGHELLEDVELICRDCHQAEHDLLEAAGKPLVRPSAKGDIGGLRERVKNDKKEGGVGETIDVPVERKPDVPLLSVPGQIELVWEHYVAVMEPRRKELDPAARQVIRDALKVATAVECKRAIDGCKGSEFHMGDNDRRKKYNRLSQILKGKRGIRTTREQIDLFLDIAEKSGVEAGLPSVDPVRLSQAKRDLLTAWEFPRSEQARRAGEMSAAWLAQHGYRVEHDPETGRPTFHTEDT